jgi:hypothetical protein
MLPKEEKINPNSDLDQPGLFDKENEKDRISKKRKFVYVAMFLTVGLSLSFWIYRSIKNINFSLKLPTFNFTVFTPKTTNIITSSPYSSSLPEGFKIKELVEESGNNFSYFSKIITPNQELLLIIKISNSPDLIQSKKLIPNLINQLYWYSLQK